MIHSFTQILRSFLDIQTEYSSIRNVIVASLVVAENSLPFP